MAGALRYEHGQRLLEQFISSPWRDGLDRPGGRYPARRVTSHAEPSGVEEMMEDAEK
jgi:hypothetical protein